MSKRNFLVTDRTFGRTMTPFETAHARLIAIGNQILEFEEFAKRSLPGVLWDFSVLRGHINTMAQDLYAGFPLRAWKAHQVFALTSAAATLGGKKSERKRAAALAASKIAARKVAMGIVSEARKAASRKNLYRARRAKIRKEWIRLPEEKRAELKILREKRKLLLQAIKREAAKPTSDMEKIGAMRAERDRLRKEIMDRDKRADPSL